MKFKTFILFAFVAFFLSCSSNADDDNQIIDPPIVPTATLKESSSFPVGNIVSANRLSGSDNYFRTVLNKEFNSITAENDMKMAAMFPAPDTYDYSEGDAIVAYAKANGFRVHGHALVWHASIPNWLKNYSGTDEEFEAQVKAYVKNTVAHFAKEKDNQGNSIVASWDVVNEHFTSDAEAAVFFNRIGPDYLSKCFIWAREADPNVKLFYNDYSLGSQTSKATKVADMAKNFIDNSIPIDGIGMQMHIDYQLPEFTTLTNNVNLLKNTGLLIHFSELDITVNKAKTLTSLIESRAKAQKERYKQIVKLYRTIDESQQFGITLWGLRDNDSWLINFLNNTNEWPLLFDSNYNYKLAFIGFLEGLTE